MVKAEAAIVQRYEIPLTTCMHASPSDADKRLALEGQPSMAHSKLHRFEGPYGVCIS